MKHNRLQIFCFTAITGLGAMGLLSGANAVPEKPAPANATMENPFGPKPTEPVDSSGSLGNSAMDNTPLNANQFTSVLRAMLLERFDKNKDGTLDAAEVAEAQVLFSDGRGRQAGARGGGVASGPLFGLRPVIMRNFGKAGNETLTNAEIAKLRVFLFGKAEPAKPSANEDALRRDLLKQFDQNNDGKLDDAEIAAAKTSLLQIFSDLGKNPAAPSAAPMRPVPSPGNPPAGTKTP